MVRKGIVFGADRVNGLDCEVVLNLGVIKGVIGMGFGRMFGCVRMVSTGKVP